MFNHGRHRRDFTYIDDVVEGVVRALDRPASANEHWCAESPDPATGAVPYRLYNIGAGRWVRLERYIEVLEACLECKAKKNFLPLQPGDVPDTFANVDDLEEEFDYRPVTPIEIGVRRFVDWYKAFYGVPR